MLRHAFITTCLLFFVFIFRTYIVGILNTYIILQGLGKKGSLMIDRYTQPAMGHIFSLENKYNVWKEIEVCACEAQAELGLIGITKDEAAWIRAHAACNKEEIDALEAQVNHDVIAFLTNMASYIDKDVPAEAPHPSRWVHFGMTSTDLGDTALCYLLNGCM